MTEKTIPTLMVCLQCGSTQRDDAGAKLPNPEAEALAGRLQSALAETPVQVKLVRCLSLCAYPIAWALRDDDRHCYTFAPATDEADMVAVAQKWVTAANQGLVKKADMPESVRKTLKSRIPPVPKG